MFIVYLRLISKNEILKVCEFSTEKQARDYVLFSNEKIHYFKDGSLRPDHHLKYYYYLKG